MAERNRADMRCGRGRLLSLFAAALFACLVVPGPARACENPASAQNNMNLLFQHLIDTLNDYITQEKSLIDEKITETATYEMMLRLWEFDTNIRTGLSRLWQDKWLPAMMDMTKQLSAIQIDQSRMVGSLMDAELVNENIQLKQQKQIEAFRRYQPNETVCQMDSLMRNDAANCDPAEGCGPTMAQRMATAMTAGYAKEDTERRGNYVGTPGEFGTARYQQYMWDEYVTYWCDPAAGNQGCTAPGTPGYQGKHVDLPGLLWGDKQTIDMSVPNNRLMVKAVQRYFISPLVPDPVPPGAVNTPQGQQALLDRRSTEARYNAVFNVVSRMISERSSGSKIDTSSVRTAAGLPAANASSDASYREIMEALTRDRFHSPEYIVRMVNAPEEVVREQGAINALKMQQMNDLYKRLEEMVFMEAATFAEELDGAIPGRAEQAIMQR
jgi:hypothetical protein